MRPKLRPRLARAGAPFGVAPGERRGVYRRPEPGVLADSERTADCGPSLIAPNRSGLAAASAHELRHAIQPVLCGAGTAGWRLVPFVETEPDGGYGRSLSVIRS